MNSFVKWTSLILAVLGIYFSAFLIYANLNSNPSLLDFLSSWGVFLFVLTLAIAFACISVWLFMKDWQEKLRLVVEEWFNEMSDGVQHDATSIVEDVKKEVASVVAEAEQVRDEAKEIKADVSGVRRNIIINRDALLHEFEEIARQKLRSIAEKMDDNNDGSTV